MYAKYLAMDLKAVAADPQAQAMGERLFLNNCAQCHGSDAGGGKGFPNLRDGDWLYGGDPEVIKESITNGRNGIMPPLGSVLGGDGVRNVANYVRSLSGLPHDKLRAELGRPQFMQICAACHGADGKGNQQLGAPNLTDRDLAVWRIARRRSPRRINKGRGQASAVTRMPAHKDLLDAGKIQLLDRLRVGPVQPESGRRAVAQRARSQSNLHLNGPPAVRDVIPIEPARRRGRALRDPQEALSARGARMVCRMALGIGVPDAGDLLRIAVDVPGTAVRPCSSIWPHASSTSSAGCSGRRTSST